MLTNNKLREAAKAIAYCSCVAMLGTSSQVEAAHAPIQELREGDDVKYEVFKDGMEFGIVSFHKPSNETSNEIDGLFESAKARFEQMLDEGVLSPRKVGWFRVNIDEFPDLAP